MNAITITKIGTIETYNGIDEYVLMEDPDGDLSPTDAHDWLLSLVQRDTGNKYYCHYVTCLPQDDKVVGIVHHRYDI